MGFNRVHGDGAAAGSSCLRRVYPDGGPATSVVWRAYFLDATVEDAIATLPPCVRNAGRLVLAQRIDVPDYFVAELEPDGTDTIAGDGANYPLVAETSSILLLATPTGDWRKVAEIA